MIGGSQALIADDLDMKLKLQNHTADITDLEIYLQWGGGCLLSAEK